VTFNWRRPASAVGIVVMALVGVATVAPAANAATPSTSAPAATVSVASVALTARPAARIVCEMVFIGANGGTPHHSGHVPGTVNVRVRVTCSAPVARIKATVALFSTTGSKINPYGSTGVATARGNAALVCRVGDYQGVSEATITAPPGFSPPSATITDSTARVHIGSCK
jgi:hypothetical protein